jgi:uncharacterized protein (DUF952 family)
MTQEHWDLPLRSGRVWCIARGPQVFLHRTLGKLSQSKIDGNATTARTRGRLKAVDAARGSGHPVAAMLVYKILRAEEWAELQRLGQTDGAPVDRSDGFIHFSTAAQVAETARRHFAGQTGLVLASFQIEALGPALRWEPSRGGDLFPHLYAPLRIADLWAAQPLPLGSDGRHQMPAGIV